MESVITSFAYDMYVSYLFESLNPQDIGVGCFHKVNCPSWKRGRESDFIEKDAKFQYHCSIGCPLN